MGRVNVINTATVDLTNPASGPLLAARQALISAENDFYSGRRTLINSYPMKLQDITTAQLEALYDQHYGNQPWLYRQRFNQSGSTPKDTAVAYQGGGFLQPQDNSHWMRMWPGTPNQAGQTYPDITGGANIQIFRYDPDVGAAWIDLVIRYGNYNNAFTSKGPSNQIAVQSGAGDGASTTFFTYYQGFDDVPAAFNGNGGLTNAEAHMLKLLGDAWDDEVRDAYNDYRDALDEYQDANGGGQQFDFVNGAANNPWDNFQGSERAYNRPGLLPAALINEARGAIQGAIVNAPAAQPPANNNPPPAGNPNAPQAPIQNPQNNNPPAPAVNNPAPGPANQFSITLTSTTFQNGGNLPEAFNAFAPNTPYLNWSPQLSWTTTNQPPVPVTSWGLRCYDLQGGGTETVAPYAGAFIHWKVNDIPVGTTNIGMNLGWPVGVTVFDNDWTLAGFTGIEYQRLNGWGGPAGATGHNYEFYVIAFDANDQVIAVSNTLIAVGT